jgi:cytochrome c551/c552
MYVVQRSMKTGLILGAIALIASIGVSADPQGTPNQQRPEGRAQQSPAQTATQPTPAALTRSALEASVPDAALVQKYCLTCHSARVKTAGLSLEGMNPADAAAHADVWEKVVTKVRGGMMPPQGMPRPDEPTLEAFAVALEQTLDRGAQGTIKPGYKPVHRLNRTEYGNAVRDLLDLQVDVTDLLPADDESNGFDNIAGVLRVSPSLLEQYLSAARRISSLAVGSDTDVVRLAYRISPDDSQEDHVEGLPLGTRGGLLFRHNFPQDAEYEFATFLLRNIVGYMKGLEYGHLFEVSIDGERVFSVPVGGDADNRASDTNMSEAANKIDERLKTRVKVKAGPHMVGVTFAKRNSSESDEPLQPHERDHDLQNMNGIPIIDHVNLTGPFNPTGPGDTPSRRRIFTCNPSTGSGRGPAQASGEAASAAAKATARSRRSSPEIDTSEGGCARRVLTNLATRAYRRPVTAADMEPILALYDAGRKKGDFNEGIEQGLRLILASPKFLFRTEAAAGLNDKTRSTAERVTDVELASRLSFFLWSSIPDEELLTVASKGTLSQPAMLERQVKRMLADPKSRALVDNFASQWLMLRNLKGHIPTPGDFPNFDNELRQAFRQETEMFVESIMREDRSLIDLIGADYTFVNERLARHYGIQNVYGSYFRKVVLKNEERRGLLGQGSVLTVTSYPNRTSPVLRGKYILENILGTPPPAPPPDVPDLKENQPGEEAKSLRARLEMHRATPNCASCHRVMDPLGLALENFDGIGQWRVKEPGGNIDPNGQLADGSRVDGPVALRKAVLKRPELFVRTVTQKLMTYGLGRGTEYTDMPVIRGIAGSSAAQNYRFSSVVLGIVKSVPFQMKTAQNTGLVASH